MKVHIFFHFQPLSGGGNQFLKSLQREFEKKRLHVKDPKDADIILFNAHQHSMEILKFKKLYPKKRFVHRVDGISKLYNHQMDRRDNIVSTINSLVADGTVFQSNWSKCELFKRGFRPKSSSVILNAPDPAIFNNIGKNEYVKNGKIKIISTSWSKNRNKGFEIYSWLDKNLDFSNFEMTFVGNSPISFKNIEQIEALPSLELSKELKKHHVYITASKFEACSNALLESIHSGLIPIAFSSGSNTEIISDSSLLFKKANEIPKILDSLKKKDLKLKTNFLAPVMDEVSSSYITFLKEIIEKPPTTLPYFSSFRLKKSVKLYSIFQHLHKAFTKTS